MTPEAERFNGWAAMLGFVAAVGVVLLLGMHLNMQQCQAMQVFH